MNQTTRQSAIESAAQLALYQMEQCEKAFRDDTEFMQALTDLRAAFAMKVKPLKVWVLTMDIDNSGISSEVFTSENAAKASLYGYATEYWANEMGKTPLPLTRDEVIADYFGREDTDDRYILERIEVES